MSATPLDEPYYLVDDLDRLERVVQRLVFDEGYNGHAVGLRMKDCPRYAHKKWKRWWRALRRTQPNARQIHHLIPLHSQVWKWY
jgi:hypothetical protein